MSSDLVVSGLGDHRRDARGTLLLERIVAHESAQLRSLAHSRSEEVGFARWLACPHFTSAEVCAGLHAHTVRRCYGQDHVLVVQDTSEINYQAHAGQVSGLGPVGNGRDLGLFIHGLLALDAEGERCLGLLDAFALVRTPREGDHRRVPIEAKESFRWLQGVYSASTLTGVCRQVTVVGDRESDIYELFARRPDQDCHVLVRACRNRKMANGRFLYETMDEMAACFCTQVTVPPRPGAPERTARLALRYGAVRVPRPSRCRGGVAAVDLWAVTASEFDASVPAKKRITWRLLTTHEVDSPAKAVQVIDWYRKRWHIEQVFRVLKRQGLDVEASQSTTATGLSKLAVLSTYAAARIHQLVLARDGQTPVPADDVFDSTEMQTLTALLPTCEGKTDKQKNPHPPQTLAWCAWIIARLGGWKGYRKSEGPPGPLTMTRGYQRFQAIHEGYKLAQINVCKP